MNKKQKVIIVISVIVVLILLIGLYLFINSKPKETQKSYHLEKTKSIDICKTTNCPIPDTINFNKVEYDTDIKEIQRIIKIINDETDNYYNMVTTSNINDAACSAVKDIYNYRTAVFTNYNSYTNDDYINLSIKRTIVDVCTNEKQDGQVESYIYDRKQKKLITQEEFKIKQNIGTKKINDAITTNNTFLNENANLNLSLEDTYVDGNQNIVLYYDTVGNLIASYYQTKAKQYYTASIDVEEADKKN